MKSKFLLAVALSLVFAPNCFAPPPLVTGDVPTAGKDSFEWYFGGRYQEAKRARLLACCRSPNSSME
jgi:hypothetical protein